MRKIFPVFKRLLLIFFCVLAFQNASAESASQLAPDRHKKIIVKFKDDSPVGEIAAHLFNTSQQFEKITGHAGIDTFNKVYQVKKIERLFKNFKTEPITLTGAISRGEAVALHDHARQTYNEKNRTLMGKRLARSQQLHVTDAAALPYLDNIYVVEADTDVNIEKICADYAALPDIAYAQPNYRVQTQFVPNDPYYSSSGSWGQAYDDLWGLKKIDAADAWDISQGANVVVAVVDTGVDYTHPDIAANIWTNAGEISGNGVDDDGNGFTDDVRGWNFSSNDNDPMDDNGHGTHVAGTIAAVGNNNLGIIGVAPSAKIMPVKCFSSSGAADISTLANGIIYAANNGADVINNSWGCSSACPSDPVAEDAVRYAYGMGAAVVFAAGNSNDDVAQYSPQNQPESITVAATTEIDARSFFSNYGTWIDVAAPGSGENISPPSFLPIYNILSLRAQNTGVSGLIVNGSYLRDAGTSMAAPHVSGVAALIASAHPEYSVEQIRQALRKGGDDILTPGYDLQSGYGRLNAYKSLSIAAPLEVRITSPIARTISDNGTIEIRGTVNGAALASWVLDYGTGGTPASWATIASAASPIVNKALGTLNLGNVTDVSYTLRLRGINSSGETYEDRRLVSAPDAADANWSALGSGVVGVVYPDVTTALAVDASGNLYAGGYFTTAGGVTVNGIAKWDGASWSALGSGMGGTAPYVYALAVDASGNLYAGGQFTTAGGVTANRIAKWNGTSWSAVGSGMGNGAVDALALDASGNLYAGGAFDTAGGVAINGIAKWNGTSWSSLGWEGIDGVVYALAVDASGSLYAGGAFNSANGQDHTAYIAKWDGSNWSALGSGMDYIVSALAIDASHYLYAGGYFTTAGGVTVNKIAKWDGANWSALGSGADYVVSALAIDASHYLYAGGQFTTAGGVTVNKIAKWDGSSWSSLGSGVGGGSGLFGGSAVVALVIDASNYLNVGGHFTTAGGKAANNVARYSNVSFPVSSTTTVPVISSSTTTTTTIAAGTTTIPANANWSALGSGVNGDVYTFAIDASGNVFAGGSFTTAGGAAANNIATWNGSSWLALGSGVQGPVQKLAVDSLGNVYAGGAFTTAGGVTVNGIAKWNGTSWSALGSGMGGTGIQVNTLAIDASDNVYAGGWFTTAGGVTVNHIAKWDGSSWSALGSGMNNGVYALALDSSGNLYAGGDFITAGEAAANNIAKWDGSSWSALGLGVNNSVDALAADASGNVYAGGRFTTADGAAAHHVATWNGSSWSTLGSGMNSGVYALVLDSSGNLYAGGDFTTAGGKAAHYVARWSNVSFSSSSTTTAMGSSSTTTSATTTAPTTTTTTSDSGTTTTVGPTTTVALNTTTVEQATTTMVATTTVSQTTTTTTSENGTTTTVGPTTTITTTAAGSSTTTTTSQPTLTTIPGGTTTTTTVSNGPCPAMLVLGADNPKLENLRNFRDRKLAQNAVGRKLIQIYYSNAESINDALDRNPSLREAARRVLEIIAPLVGRQKQG